MICVNHQFNINRCFYYPGPKHSGRDYPLAGEEPTPTKMRSLGSACSLERDVPLISGKTPLNFNLTLFQNTSEEFPLCGSVIILRVVIEVFRDAEQNSVNPLKALNTPIYGCSLFHFSYDSKFKSLALRAGKPDFPFSLIGERRWELDPRPQRLRTLDLQNAESRLHNALIINNNCARQ